MTKKIDPSGKSTAIYSGSNTIVVNCNDTIHNECPQWAIETIRGQQQTINRLLDIVANLTAQIKAGSDGK